MSKIHPLTLSILKICYGSYGGSPVHSIEPLDKEIRKWLEEKVSTHLDCATEHAREVFELNQEPKWWCKHMIEKESRPEFETGWMFCPICGAKRP